MSLSVVILAKNEEKNIADCLKSVKFADEIIVVDDYSSDETVEISRKMEAKVYSRELKDDFATQRNFGLKKASGKWVLFIDADERLSAGLKDEIIQIKENPFLKESGFFIKRQDFLWGRQIRHGEAGAVKLLRLARRDAGKWRRRVHESWEIRGRVGTLKNPILHYPHPTLKEFLAEINKFSSLHAEANKEEGKKATPVKIIFYPAGHFFKNFIIKRGFLEKEPGFLGALMMSLHSFLAWSKLWVRETRSK